MPILIVVPRVDNQLGLLQSSSSRIRNNMNSEKLWFSERTRPGCTTQNLRVRMQQQAAFYQTPNIRISTYANIQSKMQISQFQISKSPDQGLMLLLALTIVAVAFDLSTIDLIQCVAFVGWHQYFLGCPQLHLYCAGLCLGETHSRCTFPVLR